MIATATSVAAVGKEENVYLVSWDFLAAGECHYQQTKPRNGWPSRCYALGLKPLITCAYLRYPRGD